MLRAIFPEELDIRRFVDPFRRQRMHDARDVEEVPVVEIVGNAVASPGPASHREREWQSVVEAAAGGEAVRLIDDDAGHRQLEAQLQRTFRLPRMKADRVAGPW